ncbi:MFS transporter [Bacillus sp. CH126_4D]|uniref:MDR family MFS transporter n=1 Tax=unclassified Bacillus (in: firmicutes) TaxID=185979 RepID=UPI00124DBD77|nr:MULTISPECIES: MFS transporter [unclassified Bacillus (in: firmicutes)]KAB2453101.1 MFS transporter [Bacillus sp. CH140a_4T]KAB2472596.1 MFS transporter [Bacillus sp. CH126_4D]
MKWLSWDRNLKTRLIGETMFNTLFWMYFPFMAIYYSDAFGKAIGGILMAIIPLVGIIGNLLGGYLADRLGRRPVMLLGTIIQVAMFAVFALSHSHWINYLAYIGIGISGAIYSPASSAMIADIVPEKDRRVVFATFVTANNIGAVFGPVLGSFLFFHYRSELLWTCTIVTFIYFIAIYFIIRETLPEASKNDGDKKQISKIFKEQWNNYTKIFSDKIFAIYIVAGIFIMIAFLQLDLYLALYVKEFVPTQSLFSWNIGSFSLSNTQIFGWMMGLNGILFVLCSLPVAKYLENWSDRNVLIVSNILFGTGMFLIGLTTNIWLLFGFMAILTIGELIRSPVVHSFVSKYAPENSRGQYMAASNLQFTIGRFIAPIMIVFSTWLSPIVVFGIILLCTLVSAVLYVKVFRMISNTNIHNSTK